jgi:hypothetical protein
MRKLLGPAILLILASPTLAEERPALALHLEAKASGGPVRITVALKNQTRGTLRLRDFHQPSFNPYTWLQVEVDGKEGRLISLGAFTLATGGAETAIAAKGRLVLGDIAVLTEREVGTHKDGYVPMLIVKPGEHTLRFAVSKDLVDANKLDKAPTATLKVELAR